MFIHFFNEINIYTGESSLNGALILHKYYKFTVIMNALNITLYYKLHSLIKLHRSIKLQQLWINEKSEKSEYLEVQTPFESVYLKSLETPNVWILKLTSG